MTNTIKDDKLKPLLPTLRIKKRFIRVTIESSHNFSFKELSEALTQELILLLGAIDLGKSGFWILRDSFDSNKQEFICRVKLNYCEKIQGALALISCLENYEVALRVENISGTLKGVRKEN